MLDVFFIRVGPKLKDTAKIYFRVTTILLLVFGVVALGLAIEYARFLGWLVLVPCLGVPVAILMNLIFSWVLYAIGESAEVAERTLPDAHEVTDVAYVPQPQAAAQAEAQAQPQREEYVFDEDEPNPFAADAVFVDVYCPKCHAVLSFVKGTTKGMCPECGHEFTMHM